MKGWSQLSLQSPACLELKKSLQAGRSLVFEELWDCPKAFLATFAQEVTQQNVLIVMSSLQEESRLYQDLTYFSKVPVWEFPAWETLPSEGVAPSPDIVGARMEVLRALNGNKQAIVLANLQSCLQKLLPKKELEGLYLKIQVGEELSLTLLIEQLLAMGYERKVTACDKGEMAVRGGLLDLFPVSSPDPYRIVFCDERIESIRTYDPIGQKSITSVESMEITFAHEWQRMQKEEEMATLLDYLGPKTLVIFDGLLALEDRYATLVTLIGKKSRFFSSLDEFWEATSSLQKIYWSEKPLEELGEVKQVAMSLEARQAKRFAQPISTEICGRPLHADRVFLPIATSLEVLVPGSTEETEVSSEILLNGLKESEMDPWEIHFLVTNDSEEQHLKAQLEKAHIEHSYNIHRGYLSSGMGWIDSQQLLISITDLTHRHRIRRQKQRSTQHTARVECSEYVHGDYVVHYTNGIGRFVGVEKKHNHLGKETEFFAIEYAGQAKLYVPMSQAYLVNKYIGGSGETTVALHTLGGTRWKNTRERTEESIQRYARELLEIYAKRHLQGGFAFPKDGPEMMAFEQEFPFDETEDQLTAIAAIKQDMMQPRAMDRVLCGDVGYGKTEVAMRAAFKAAVEGKKQVAILVPTTVLATQHYETFRDRAIGFSLRIALLSRTLTPKKIHETLKALKEGNIDIVIGTHRLLSYDVHFKDLGLLVIDEEQRFGVKAKEHLKKMKVGVDCLTLSATPIPRTLYLSMVGVRDMSIIRTPPHDRLPVQTILAQPSNEIIRNALLRELARDGQAFIIHNRVETIYEYASFIQKLVPQARIVVGHGQMDADAVDEIFHAFKSGKADILIATTIIENGIDIPNANTILIDRADRFGLAALYQLRGRVGRWNRRAYAYFLVPHLGALSEVSRARLEALLRAGTYGGGMEIAKLDLQQRGPGGILEEEQSGHMTAIGFYHYLRMLTRTIEALKGDVPAMLSEPKIELHCDARLPEDYVNDVTLRMELYQRFGECVTWAQLEEIWKEMQDRYGAPPVEASWLYYSTRLRIEAGQKGVTLVKWEHNTLTFERQVAKKVINSKSAFKAIQDPVEIETKILPRMRLWLMDKK